MERCTRLAQGLALAAALAACASGGGGEDASGERVYTDWDSFLQAELPHAEFRGRCIVSLGRGGNVSLRANPPPPVVEVDGQRFFDGCIPAYLQPEDVAEIEALGAAEASTILGIRGGSGMVRIRTKSVSR